MAEGGFDPMDETTDETLLIPRTGDDDDDDTNDWDNTDLNQPPADTNSTNPFEPGASSTPYGGEKIPMTTRLPPEKQGASGTAETSFTTGVAQEEPGINQLAGRELTMQERMVFQEVHNDFRNADLTQLDLRYKHAPRAGKGGGQIIEVKLRKNTAWHRLMTKSAGDTDKTLNQSLSPAIKEALGVTMQPDAVDAMMTEANKALQEQQTKEAAQLKALNQAHAKAEEAQRLRRELEALRGRNKDVEDRIQQLEDTQGPLDKEAIQKLKDEKKQLAADHQAKRKQLDALAKATQQAQKLQQDINKTRLSKAETERRLGQLKAQKDALQPLDELKQKAAELNEHITEDMRIVEDENTSPSEREAARERLAVRNEELEELNEEIEARERQRPLLERVKEIFKKYGWTLQAVVLAVGLVLGALAIAGLNGLKAGTKAVGQGLKTVGQKLGSLLPGLIGSIVSFIFKAAGQVFSFLAEHAWLLILAVVAFFMERLLKKRRT